MGKKFPRDWLEDRFMHGPKDLITPLLSPLPLFLVKLVQLAQNLW